MIRCFMLYFLIYCPLGVLCPLIGQYLSSIGFSGTQVGTVTSLGTAAAVLGGMFWGKVYANSSHKKRVIAIMFAGAALMSMAGLSTKAFIIYAAIYSVMYFFQGPVHGLCDSLVMESDNSFAVIRSAGALGYALAVYVTGQYAETHGLGIIFYVYSAAFILAAFVVMGVKEPQHYSSPEKKIKASELFKNKKYVKLLLCAFFLMGTNVGNSTYFGYLFREGGGSLGGIGLAFLLMAGSEAPFMFLIPAFNRKVSSEKLLLIAIGVCTFRFAFYATGPSWQLLLGTFFLQGISNGIILVELVRYFSRVVEPRLASIAVSTFYAVGNNLSTIVCTFIGGIMLDAFSARGVYFFFAVWNMIALIMYIAMGLYKEENHAR
ncbi:MAG: MFS transporter [Anaerovoracaceae bacterium]